MHQNLISFFKYISIHRKFQFLFLIFLTLISALFEVFSIGSVIPFITFLINPEKLHTFKFIGNLSEFIETLSKSQIIVYVCFSFSALAIISSIIRSALLRYSILFSNSLGADLSQMLFKQILFQSYSYFINVNSSTIISLLTQKIPSATAVLSSYVIFMTSFILLAIIIVSLFLMSPAITLGSCIFFFFFYIFIAYSIKSRLHLNSLSISNHQTQIIKLIQEALGSIRDITMSRTHFVYTSLYSDSSQILKNAISENTFLNQAPRYLMEGLGMVAISFFVMYIGTQTNQSLSSSIPLLAALALAAQKVIPLAQQLFSNWSFVAGNKDSVQEVLNLLESTSTKFTKSKEPLKKFSFNKNITLKNVSFKYLNAKNYVLKGVNIKFYKGEMVGIVGSTGSGKSTLIDILMGLLTPTKGSLYIDGQKMNKKNILFLQNIISHVPQKIYLLDSTIAENIAFGRQFDQIDFKKLRDVCRMANILELIENHKDKFKMQIGERGVKLSGGQIQRISIARALYKEASILILDEATSSVDIKTEYEIMRSINKIKKNVTIFIIAHRLSTLKNCSKIIKLENGNLHQILDLKNEQ